MNSKKKYLNLLMRNYIRIDAQKIIHFFENVYLPSSL